jgi:hypothetical protein
MELLYGKKFSKDLDAIRHETKIKAELLKLIEAIRAADSLTDRFLHRKDIYRRFP